MSFFFFNDSSFERGLGDKELGMKERVAWYGETDEGKGSDVDLLFGLEVKGSDVDLRFFGLK